MPMHANGYVNNIYFQLPIPKNKICLHTGRRITLDVNIRKKNVSSRRARPHLFIGLKMKLYSLAGHHSNLTNENLCLMPTTHARLSLWIYSREKLQFSRVSCVWRQCTLFLRHNNEVDVCIPTRVTRRENIYWLNMSESHMLLMPWRQFVHLELFSIHSSTRA